MHSDSRKKVNARENGCENREVQGPRVNERFCEALAHLMGQEKLIRFVRMLQQYEPEPSSDDGKTSKSDSKTGNGMAND